MRSRIACLASCCLLAGLSGASCPSGTSNVAPVAQNQAVTLIENVPKSIQLVATDADDPAQPLTYSIVTQPTGGTLGGLNAATGQVTYTPNSGFTGSDSFTFTAADSSATGNTATVTITVTPSVAPVAQDQSVSVLQNGSLPVTLVATDADLPAQTLTYAIVAGPAHGTLGTLNAATGAVTYTPALGFVGADSFTFKANDGLLDSNVATVTIAVTAAPVTFTATLNGGQEAPVPVVTNASGTGTFVLNVAKTELTVDVTASGFSSAVTAAHLHKGAVGVAGGVVHPLTQITTTNGQVTITGPAWALTAADVADLEQGNIYVNIHTVNNPGGEIRGQLAAVP